MPSACREELCKRGFVELGTNHAEPAGDRRRAFPQLNLAGHKVKVQPFAAGAGNHALCAQHTAILLRIAERFKRALQRLTAELMCCFNAPAYKHFICIMPMVVMMMRMAMLMFLFMMTPARAFFMLVLMFVPMLVFMFMFMFVLVFMSMLVFMLMVMATNGANFLIFRFGSKLVKRGCKGILAFHGGKDLRPV